MPGLLGKLRNFIFKGKHEGKVEKIQLGAVEGGYKAFGFFYIAYNEDKRRYFGMITTMQLSAIRDCYAGDRNALQTKLNEYGISSNKDRSDALLKAMGKTKVFFSCGDSKDAEAEQYEALVGAFFSGVWRSDVI